MHTSSDPEETLAPGSAALPDQRLPGQSVMAELLTAHASEPPRSMLERFLGADPLGPESKPWYLGALGEIEVAKLLARLGPGWTVLHAVPVGAGASDIDHVVIGAPGVFTINTKHHAGKAIWVAGRTLMVSGQKQDHIRNSVHEASRASKLLSAAAGFQVPVAGVIALVGPKNLSIRKPTSGATVLRASQLRRWLGKRPAVLGVEAVTQIAAAAKQPQTWRQGPKDLSSPAEIQDRFRNIHEAVRAARRRRRAWGYAGMVTIAAIVITGVSLGPALLASVLQMIAS